VSVRVNAGKICFMSAFEVGRVAAATDDGGRVNCAVI